VVYSHFSPWPYRLLVPGAIWEIEDKGNVIYLTFDDGPNIEVTEWILKTLDQYHARATFFLVGQKIQQHPNLVHQLIASKHQIANHSMYHKNSLILSIDEFINDVAMCQGLINGFIGDSLEFNYYRPPYGQIRPDQLYALRKTHKIIMWSYLSGDFDPKLDLQVAKTDWNKIKKGSIVVFHDNPKHFNKLTKFLPDFLEYFTEIGIRFQTLPTHF
jgi:peptidoglycan/xylan/chitin deacetylase (PgdA/CDA1 family)